jgi:hypothetical protein
VVLVLLARSRGIDPSGESLKRFESGCLGPDHPETLVTLVNLAVAYKAAGRLSEAVYEAGGQKDKADQWRTKLKPVDKIDKSKP